MWSDEKVGKNPDNVQEIWDFFQEEWGKFPMSWSQYNSGILEGSEENVLKNIAMSMGLEIDLKKNEYNF